MGFLGFGKKKGTYIMTLVYEGPNRLRLNANVVHRSQVKKNAAGHDRTVCWIEVSTEGARLDQGIGPAAGKLVNGEADQFLRDIPLSLAYRAVLDDLRAGSEQASKWYKRPQ